MSRDVRPVSFGKKDAEMIEFLKDKGMFSKYVKQLIRAEMDRIEQEKNPKPLTVDPSIEDKIDEILSLIKSGNIKVSELDDAEETEEQDELTITKNQQTAMMNSLAAFGLKKSN